MISRSIAKSISDNIHREIISSAYLVVVDGVSSIACVLSFQGHDGATPQGAINIGNNDTLSFNVAGFTHEGTNNSYYIVGSDSSEYIYIRSDGRVRFVDSAGTIKQVTGVSQLFDGGEHYVEFHFSTDRFELFVDGVSVGVSAVGTVAASSSFTTLFRRSSSVAPLESPGAIYNITFGSVASYPLQSENEQVVLDDVIGGNDLTLVTPDLSSSNFVEVTLVGDQ